MRTRTMVWLCVLMLGLGVIGPVMAQVVPASAPTAAELVYQGATVKMQVDVNGAAAVQLVGGLIDAAATAAQEQAKAMQQAGPGAHMQGQEMGPAQAMAMAGPMIEPTREIIKSLDQVTVLMMQASAPVAGDAFVSYYQNLMQERGWTPLITVRGQGMPAVASLMAPEGKGVFLAAFPGGNEEVVVALLTTTKPIGDLLGQLAAAGQSAMPQIMAMMQARQASKPPAPPAPPAKPHARKAPAKRK